MMPENRLRPRLRNRVTSGDYKPGAKVFIAQHEISRAVRAFSAPLHFTGLWMSRAYTIAHCVARSAAFRIRPFLKEYMLCQIFLFSSSIGR
jgi:hypothetical protein